MANTISLKFDDGDFKGKAQAVAATLSQQTDAIQKLALQMVEFNSQGDRVRETYKGITDSGAQAVIVIKKVKDELRATTSVVKDAADQFKVLKEAQERAASVQRAVIGGKVESSVRTAVDTTAFTKASEFNAFESKLRVVRDLVSSGSVEVTRFQELFTRLSQNPLQSIENLTASEQKLVSALRSMISSTREAATAQAELNGKRAEGAKIQAEDRRRQLDASRAESTVRVGSTTSGFNVGQLNAYEAAIQRIKAAIASGEVSMRRFQQLFEQVKLDPTKAIPNLTPQEQSLVGSLRNITAGMRDTERAGKQASESITISWQGVIRLFESQVIRAAFAEVQRAFVTGVSDSLKYSIKIAEIETISQRAGLSTRDWAQGITELSNKFGNPQTDVAEAAYQAISNQVVQGAEAFQFLDTALKFGRATVSSAADSVNLLSSAMNSFGLPASDAERISAIFFKTIELGRVRANELANTFGRVGAIASGVGVRLEEVAAALATLTIAGIKPADAMTLLNNVLLKLTNPTVELRQFLGELGFASGEAAIAALGFGGVLEKLDEEARKGTTRLSELFNEIRGIRGVIGLTGDAFGTYQENLAKITQGQEEFAKAADIVKGAIGTDFQTEVNKVKNLFALEFGDRFASGLLKVGKAFGGEEGLAGSVRKLTVVVAAGAAGFVLYKIGMGAAAIQTAVLKAAEEALLIKEQQLNTARSTGNIRLALEAAGTINSTRASGSRTVALGVQKLAQDSLNISLATGLALTGAFAVAAIGLYSYFNSDGVFKDKSTEGLEAAAEEGARKRQEQIDKMTKSVKDSETEAQKFAVEETRQGYSQRYRIILGHTAQVVAESERLKQKLVKDLHESTDALKISSKTYFDSLQKNINDLSAKATEAKSMIRESLKVDETLERRALDSLFKEKLKYASPDEVGPGGNFIAGQQSELIQKRIRQLQEEARAGFAEGTKESVENARKAFDEVEKLQEQLFQKRTDAEKKAFEDKVKAGEIGPTGIDASGKPKYEFVARTYELERQINTTLIERKRLEDDLRTQLEERQKSAEAAAEKERERLRTIQQAVLEVEKFNVLDEKGGVKAKYKANPQAAVEDLNKLIGQVEKVASTDEVKNFQIFQDLYRQRRIITQETEAAIANEQAKTIQARTSAEADARRKEVATAEASIKAADEERRRQFVEFEKALVVSQQIKDPDSGIRFGRPETIRNLREMERRSLGEAAQLQKEENNLLAAKKRLREEDNLEAAVALQKQEEITRGAREAFILKYTGMPANTQALTADAAKTPYGQEPERLSERFDREKEAVDKLVETYRKQDEARRSLDTGAKEKFDALDEVIKKIPNSMELLIGTSNRAGDSVKQQFDSMKGSARSFSTELDDILLKIKQISLPKGKLQINPESIEEVAPADRWSGGPIYMSGGGYVDWSPQGRDNIPIMGEAGEFMMNKDATSRFAPLLKAINGGSMRSQSDLPASSVTNVGDINVTVQGGSTNAQTIKNLGTELRRALKRGEISL